MSDTDKVTDELWDRADGQGDLAWKEMDDFLKALEARGPAATPKQSVSQIQQWQFSNGNKQASLHRTELMTAASTSRRRRADEC
jgi:hypothetical protein